MFFGGTAFSSHQSNVFMRRNTRWHRANEDDGSQVKFFYFIFLNFLEETSYIFREIKILLKVEYFLKVEKHFLKIMKIRVSV